ncbi:type II toxin-antitoxin system VapC family toxin [Caulobacter segnis]|uniref:Ribonuclease VapC n=1 Tax=Caulobacter segnis TaxID=88688 RepID=A0A2W5V0C6_9CAUL|nr:type II toxin-antitoxin system VapC family toxin [Caulobacter segnis]PZR32702.1 MAG: VapC toxin family PIN domain ribonuclease [Caulobacter segnis]
MIVVDTSALMAIALGETTASACHDALAAETEVLISAATAVEAMIVAHRKNVAEEMSGLLNDFGFSTVPVALEDVDKIAAAYRRWGKGFHPAGLNFGDCFAYALAHERGCPLLFVGEDFASTDVVSAL